jgi:hypothetical protein
MEIEVEFNQYKGSGKHWVAEVDGNNKIIGFVKEKRTEYDGKQYKGWKIYELKDGRYMINEAYTGGYDLRQIVKVENGEMKKISEYKFNNLRFHNKK